MSTRTEDYEVQRITPAQAEELLEYNSVNRGLRTKVVEAYRRDMNHGRWRFTGEPIQFSRTGRLLNGQHRLTALAGSEVDGIEFMVIRGLDDYAQSLMDQGAARGVADALKIAHGNVKNISVVATLARWMVAHPNPGEPGMLSNLKRKVSAAEAVEAYEHHEDIQLAADRAVSMRGHIPGTMSGLAYAWLHLNRADSAACNEYFGAIVDLNFGVKDDPRKAALKRLTQMSQDSETRGDKANAVALISVITRSWNAWRKGEEMTTIMARNSKRQPIDPVRPI